MFTDTACYVKYNGKIILRGTKDPNTDKRLFLALMAIGEKGQSNLWLNPIDFELTTNWNSLLETDSSGALDLDTTINLSFLLSKEFGADCKLDFDNGK